MLAGVERMAGRADFDVQRLGIGRAGAEGMTTAAGHGDFLVLGMDGGFHGTVLIVR